MLGQVVSDAADGVTFEPSTSPVDPGDEAKVGAHPTLNHDPSYQVYTGWRVVSRCLVLMQVRPAFDAVWLSTPLGKASPGTGMSRGTSVLTTPLFLFEAHGMLPCIGWAIRRVV